MKITVIIPVYNSIDYIRKCLDSVCGQTYKNLEIICVNDGSTDGTAVVLDEYAASDQRLTVIHQKNSGESAARNRALEICTGDYIAFVDCDDWIEGNMYQELLQMAERDRVDLVASGYIRETNKTQIIMKNDYSVSLDVFGRNRLLRYVYYRDRYRGFSGFIWCKLFKRELIFNKDKLRHSFNESIRFGGDVLFFAEVACDVKRAVYTPKAYYHYIQRPGSTIHTSNLDYWMEFLEAYQKVIDYFNKENIEEETVNLVIRFKAYWASLVLQMAEEQNNQSVCNDCRKIMRDSINIYEKYNREYPERLKRYRELLSKS